METEQEIQFGLDTFEPEALQALTFLGGNHTDWTVFIPVRPTLRHWKANQYNLNTRGLGLLGDPGDPIPTGRLQIAVYCSLIGVGPLSTGGTPFADMVSGSYYDSGTLTGVTAPITIPNFPSEVFALGGAYWIIIRFSDLTPSGSGVYQFPYSGWTISDVNLIAALLDDVTSTGNLPATYTNTANLRTLANNFPFLKANYV